MNVIWAGTDDGLVHVTRDGGKTWKNVTPPELRAWDKVSQIDAGHFDANTAYIAVNAIRRDDMRPHIYKTHDGGRTWTRIVSGINPMGPVNVVREDPKKPGLLFAGTEREVVFSADDGASWQSLRMNMPASSIRDLVIKDDDLVIGTHGRSIWIMDNIAPLREVAAAAAAKSGFLFTPPVATRVRWNMFSDTPLPPEEPTGQNPPDGAILDYYLPARGEERHARDRWREQRGHSALCERRRAGAASTRTRCRTRPTGSVRTRRSARAPDITASCGTCATRRRAGRDDRMRSPRSTENTPSGPRGPFVHPGGYTVRLTVDGRVEERPLDRPHGSAREDRARRPARADRRVTRVLSRVSRAAGHCGRRSTRVPPTHAKR